MPFTRPRDFEGTGTRRISSWPGDTSPQFSLAVRRRTIQLSNFGQHAPELAETRLLRTDLPSTSDSAIMHKPSQRSANFRLHGLGGGCAGKVRPEVLRAGTMNPEARLDQHLMMALDAIIDPPCSRYRRGRRRREGCYSWCTRLPRQNTRLGSVLPRCSW
jgi:hypothetical protein